MDKKLAEIYQGIIMQHNNHPVNFRKMEDCDLDLNAYNPLCGDHFHIYLKIDGRRIKSAHFHGYGCAICKASTSILVQSIEGKELNQLQPLIDQFRSIFEPDSEPSKKEVLEAFRPVVEFPSRIKCATLSWDELAKYLDNRD